MAKKLSTRDLESQLRPLLAGTLDDGALLAALHDVAGREPAFGGLTPLWGPALYRRNRAVFRPLIMANFATFSIDPGKMSWISYSHIDWKKHQRELDDWLAETDRLDDTDLFRRLFDWKHRKQIADRKSGFVAGELKRRLRQAKSDAERSTILKKLDVYCPLKEMDAVEIYELAPRLASDFVLNHLHQQWRWLALSEKREYWTRLIEVARKHGDDALREAVYRRTVTIELWEKDADGLCRRIHDPGELAEALEKIQPEGWFDRSMVLFRLADRHGRLVVPYILRNLAHLRRFWGGSPGYKPLKRLALDRDWQDVWIGMLRTCATQREYNDEIADWMKKERIGDREIRHRLLLLCGVSREWNFAGFSMASIHALTDENALMIYDRFPDLIRGPYRLHLQATHDTAHEKLLDRLIAGEEEDLIDFLASRFAVQHWSRPARKTAYRLSEYYEQLREDSGEFTRRAANVLGRIPAYSIWNNYFYKELIGKNRLARLLFERSDTFYLGDPGAMQDLVEAPEIHVQALAYRALGLDDERARACAAMNLDILLGTLLRPLHRRTRLAALRALANAATTPENAARIIARAREALDLPDKRYPKDDLVALLGRLLYRWPELRDADEQPVVYGAVA